MNISIIGTGYVGLTTGTCFAERGHHVLCIDNNEEKIKTLLQGKIPIYEPGLEDLIKKNVAAKRLTFSTSTQRAVETSEAIFIAVPTPPQEDGSVNLIYIEKVAREIASYLKPNLGYRVIVDKSTVPVKTGDKIAKTIMRYAPKDVKFGVASNPEFLREGCAVNDLLNPDRIIIGSNEEEALNLLQKIYAPFLAPILVTDINSAELIKHAANSFLALKISYINVVSEICERSDADVKMISKGMGMDKRIGSNFLNAGLGYGGSCFPKDLKAFISVAQDLGVDFGLLKEVERINDRQRNRFLNAIREKLWVLQDKKVALWGLAFKQNTDDIRESVAIKLAQQILAEGASIRAYDPQAIEATKKLGNLEGDIAYFDNAYDCLDDADVLIIATEWEEFRVADLTEIKKRLANPLIFDGRNLLNPKNVIETGLNYQCIGKNYPQTTSKI